MREILFRGQLRKKGEKVNLSGEPLDGIWVYGGIFAASTDSDRCIITSYENLMKYPVHAETVGQFTDLTDRNGTKIFEGDIVRYLGSDGNNYYGDVYYKDGAWWINFKKYFKVILMDLYEKVKVIGNIHDNPEMLTE